MKIIIVGASGMLGSAIFNHLSQSGKYNIYAFCRSDQGLNSTNNQNNQIFADIDLNNWENVRNHIISIKPDVLINCSGVIKQTNEVLNVDSTIYINSIIPKRLDYLSLETGFRHIHFSTDCVFNGKRGNYSELDMPNSDDLYGISKFLGEPNGKNSIIIRTSIIGHELKNHKSLVDWFLSQKGSVLGYSEAIFSGFPTNIIAEILEDYILENTKLSGLYHISSNPIDKFSLLCLIKDVYNIDIEIIKSNKVIIDRSLNSSKFQVETGYIIPSWKSLVRSMHQFRSKYYV